MSDDYDDFYEEEPERPRDHAIDAARRVLLTKYFPVNGTGVYYGRQLEIWLEDQFFHWITKKALNELAAEARNQFR
jgi:hypothetical protein